MATFNADEMIGKTLIAKQNVIAYYGAPGSKSIFQIFKGQNLGLVFSWINKNTPNGALYWMFHDHDNKPYYVLHDPNKIALNLIDQATTKSDQQKATEATEAAKKESEGTIPYYVEKWGKPVLITIFVLGIAKIVYDDRHRD